ncbi:MAG: 50S ribosomal protein L18 [Rickettsiales bacterium]|nr:50S ribosomal protein L18 [Rickettsiales bacterium]
MLNNTQRRKYRVRSNLKINNKSGRPRVVVTRSNKNIHAQLIDINGKVLKAFSTKNLDATEKGTGTEKAKKVGIEFAKLCLKDKISEVVFDKGPYIYNGRVKAIAEGCREAGLAF